ncbi:MAG: ester cyclase [Thermomicrobiales bacterium]
MWLPKVGSDAAALPDAANPEAIKGVVKALRTSFPDIRVTVDEVLSDSDLVVVRWTSTGTFAVEFQGVAPTGEQVAWSGTNMFRLACGLIVEVWSESDTLTQLGLGLDTDTTSLATPDGRATRSPDCVDLSEEDNTNVAVQWMDIWKTKDVSLYEALVSPDTIHHFGLRRDSRGLQALQDGAESFFTAFPDLTHTNEEIAAEGDLVAVRFSNNGTFTGPFLGAEPTGKEVTWTGINIFRFECGVVAESWAEVSSFDLWQQLGILERTATPAS